MLWRQGPWIVVRYSLWSFLCIRFRGLPLFDLEQILTMNVLWQGGDTVRHKDDARMDMAVRDSKF